MVEESLRAQIVDRIDQVDLISVSYTHKAIFDIDETLVVRNLSILSNFESWTRLRDLLAFITFASGYFLLHLVNEANSLRKRTDAILYKVVLSCDGLVRNETHLVQMILIFVKNYVVRVIFQSIKLLFFRKDSPALIV